jgi:hypothetical protein
MQDPKGKEISLKLSGWLSDVWLPAISTKLVNGSIGWSGSVPDTPRQQETGDGRVGSPERLRYDKIRLVALRAYVMRHFPLDRFLKKGACQPHAEKDN